MKSRKHAVALSALAVVCCPVVASADVLFSDNFDDGNAASRYTQFSQDNDGAPPDDVAANFNFNYGAFTYWHVSADESNQNVGEFIPQAPRSTGAATIGLRLDVNNALPGNSAVINVYPTLSQYVAIPSGDHKLTFDVWMNYNGRFEGGGGSMEWFSAGVNQAGGGIGGIIPVGNPNNAGFAMAINGERTNTLDYRFYRNNTRLGSLDASSGYVAQDEGPGLPGPADGRNQFYQQLFPFVNPNDPNDQWYETPGGSGKHWNTVEIRVEDEIVYYSVKPDGAADFTLIAARTDRTVTSGQIMLGYADTIAGIAQLEDGDGSLGTGGFGDHNFGVFDNVVAETVTQTRQTWSNPAGGIWSSNGNWTNGVPNATNAVADFTSAIVAPQTVTVDAPHIVRSIVFDNANSYTIAGTNAITIDGFTSGIRGTLKANNGSHTISAPLVLNKDTDAIIAAGARINVTEEFTTAAGVGIEKTGGGTLQLKNARLASLAVNQGTVEITPNGTAAGMSIVNSLTIATGAVLAMNDNDFIVDYTGASPEFTLRDKVKAFADNPAATSGISFTQGAGDVTIAVAEKTEWGFSTFNGVTLDDTTVIGKYTYYGDSNLDGAVTSDDYVAVDVGLGTGDSWVQGDFNFSGSVTSDDYVAIDVNLGKGTPTPLAWAELKAEMVALHTAMFGDEYVQKLALAEAEGYAALVPEPGALSLVGLAAAGLLARRRRT